MTETGPPFDHNEILRSATRLLADGRMDDARELLLVEGYIKRSHPAIQRAYPRLLPEVPTLRTMLTEVYSHLDDPNPKVRLDAATKVYRECAKVYPRDNVRWMRDPRATEPLIKAARDPDSRVSERAVKALSCLVCSYFPDQRAVAAFLPKLSDRKQDVRITAIHGIGGLRREDLLEHFVDLFEHGTPQDRAAVASNIAGLALEGWENQNQRPLQWTAPGRRSWTDRMITALRDSHPDVRKQAAIALKSFSDRRALAALQASRRVEVDATVAYWMDDAIAALGT
jgi:HEAT repeat protein